MRGTSCHESPFRKPLKASERMSAAWAPSAAIGPKTTNRVELYTLNEGWLSSKMMIAACDCSRLRRHQNNASNSQYRRLVVESK